MQPLLSLSNIKRVSLKEFMSLAEILSENKKLGQKRGKLEGKTVLLQSGICSEAPGGKRDENIHFLDPVSEHSTLSNGRREQFSLLMSLQLLIGAWNRMLLLNRDHFPASCPTPRQCQQLFV